MYCTLTAQDLLPGRHLDLKSRCKLDILPGVHKQFVYTHQGTTILISLTKQRIQTHKRIQNLILTLIYNRRFLFFGQLSAFEEKNDNMSTHKILQKFKIIKNTDFGADFDCVEKVPRKL
jgi:hypothetical protein